MPFEVFHDDSSSSSETSAKTTSSLPKLTLRQPTNRQTTHKKAALQEVKIESKFKDQNKLNRSVIGLDNAKTASLLQPDTPLPQNKENYDILRKIYSTEKKKAKSAADLEELCRTPLEDITFHYQSRLKRTLLSLNLDTSESFPALDESQVKAPVNDKGIKSLANKQVNCIERKSTVAKVLRVNPNVQKTESATCEKIEKQLKKFETQAKNVPKDRKKILLMRL